MIKWFFSIVLLPNLFAMQLYAQSATSQRDSVIISASSQTMQDPSIKLIFGRIEASLKNNSTDEFKKDFGSVVAMTIGSSERGYYSSNQATSILNAYLAERKLISFEFSQVAESIPVPYATGRLVSVQKGIQESTQVYVSLAQQDSIWVITQFNIY